MPAHREQRQYSTYFIGARVEHEGLALLFGVCPSVNRDARPEGPCCSQPGEHDGLSLF